LKNKNHKKIYWRLYIISYGMTLENKYEVVNGLFWLKGDLFIKLAAKEKDEDNL
jgi:hypothetical protein